MDSDSPYLAAPVEGVRNKVARAAVLTTALHIGSRIAELLFTAILARLLAPTEFGVVAAALVFIQFAKLFVEIGIGATIVQLPDLSHNDVRTAGTLVALNALLFFLLAQLLAPLIATGFAIPQVENALRALAFVFLFQAIGIVPENLLVRRLDAPHVMIAEMASRLIGFGGVGALCAFVGFGYWSLVAGALAEALIKAVTLAVIVRPPMVPMWNKTSVQRLLTRGVGFSFSRVLNFFALSADKVIAGRMLGPAALGIYGRAYAFMSIPAELYSKIGERLVFPALALHQDDLRRLRHAFLSGISLAGAIGMPMSTIIVILAPEAIQLLLGPQWTGVVAPLTVLAAAGYFRLGAKISGSLLRATGSIRPLILVQATYAVAVIGGCIVAAPFGTEAIAGAVSLAAFGFFLLTSLLSCQRTRASFARFAAAHTHGLALSVLTGGALYPCVAAMRAAEAAPLAVLSVAMAVLILVGAFAVVLAPKPLLGGPAYALASSIREWFGAACRRGLRYELPAHKGGPASDDGM